MNANDAQPPLPRHTHNIYWFCWLSSRLQFGPKLSHKFFVWASNLKLSLFFLLNLSGASYCWNYPGQGPPFTLLHCIVPPPNKKTNMLHCIYDTSLAFTLGFKLPYLCCPSADSSTPLRKCDKIMSIDNASWITLLCHKRKNNEVMTKLVTSSNKNLFL